MSDLYNSGPRPQQRGSHSSGTQAVGRKRGDRRAGVPGESAAGTKVLLPQSFYQGAAGSISNPEKSYHFEIVCVSMERAAQLQQLIRSFGPDAKIVERKNHYIVYIKEGAQIVDMLNIMEAHISLMNLENIRIVREMRNDVNRKVNCEAANINKTVNAAVRQMEDIHYLETVGSLDSLPEGLAEIAGLRLAHPDASLKELGEMLTPPVGKSGVNHRLRKISQLADKLRENKEEYNYE